MQNVYLKRLSNETEVYDCGDDGVMIYLAEQGVTILLNWMSARLFEQCNGKTLDEITMAALEGVNYSNDNLQNIKKEIREHLEELSSVGLIEIAGGE